MSDHRNQSIIRTYFVSKETVFTLITTFCVIPPVEKYPNRRIQCSRKRTTQHLQKSQTLLQSTLPKFLSDQAISHPGDTQCAELATNVKAASVEDGRSR
jgi:hypothetical protein